MSYAKRFMRFCNDNVVLIAGVSIIVGFHWAWWKLQNVPSLVHPDEKKDIPIILGAKSLKHFAENKYHELTDPEPKKQ